MNRPVKFVEASVDKEAIVPPEIKVPRSRPGRPLRDARLRSAASTIALLALGLVLWWAGSAFGWWSELTLPKPGDVFDKLRELVQTGEFWSDTWRTASEVGMSFVAGTLSGTAIGIVFWKWQFLGKIFEPYLVSFYAVPVVLFYPVMIVLVGINVWSVVILASIMAMIPMALNTWVGLSSLPPVYIKLAVSLGATKPQTFFQIALPGAAPFVVAGLRMAAVYALIGAVAMEFVTASAGLGFRIRYLYESFDSAGMFAYVLVVLIFSMLVTFILAIVDRMMMSSRDYS